MSRRDISIYLYDDIERINKMAADNPLGFIDECEQGFKADINDLADKVAENLESSKVILLAGPSSSGKTTTALQTSLALGKKGLKTQVVSLDDFYKNLDALPLLPDGQPDREAIEALDLAHLEECFETLNKNHEADFPIFDFVSAKRAGEVNHISLDKNSLILIEGLHALNPRIKKALGGREATSVYIAPLTSYLYEAGLALSNVDMRFVRRMIRDARHRNTPPEATAEMWPSVCRGESLYIDPFVQNADVIINSTHLYEPCVYHKYMDKIMNGIDYNSGHYPKLFSLFCAISRFAYISDRHLPEDSMLTEFLR